jgi:hypothetical protein
MACGERDPDSLLDHREIEIRGSARALSCCRSFLRVSALTKIRSSCSLGSRRYARMMSSLAFSIAKDGKRQRANDSRQGMWAICDATAKWIASNLKPMS